MSHCQREKKSKNRGAFRDVLFSMGLIGLRRWSGSRSCVASVLSGGKCKKLAGGHVQAGLESECTWPIHRLLVDRLQSLRRRNSVQPARFTKPALGGSLFRLYVCVDCVSPSRAEPVEGLYCLNRTKNSSRLFPYYRSEPVFGKLFASRWDFASSHLESFLQNLFVRLPKI